MENPLELEQPKLPPQRPCPICPDCGTKMEPLAQMCICPNVACAKKLPRQPWGNCVPCEQRKAAQEAALKAHMEELKAQAQAGTFKY